MKLIKAAGLVMLGSLAIARLADPVHAQQTQADAAAFAEFKKTCSAEIAKMRATLVSKGETMPDAELDTYFASIPEQMRARAELEERRADAAYYREAAANLRAEAAKPDAERTVGLATPVVLCYYDVLIRRETGAPARATTTPATPAVDDANGPPSSRSEPQS